MPEEIYWIWLSMALGICSETGKIILENEVRPEKLYGMDLPILRSMGFSPKQCQRIQKQRLEPAIDVYRYCKQKGYHVIPACDKFYPRRLFVMGNFPLVLYVQGNVELLQELSKRPTLAVVGSRSITRYGAQVTEMMCADLAAAGFVIVSGLAVGIDTQAHSSTIRVGGKTIAVLGCGLDVEYPACNTKLRKEILKSGGTIITELLPKEGVTGKYFPVRNRLLAGLSKAVLIVEAPQHSGALSTAYWALEQGKEVFVVPANIDKYSFQGSLQLLREGAVPAISPEDIKSAYGVGASDRPVQVVRQKIDPQKQKMILPLIEETPTIAPVTYFREDAKPKKEVEQSESFAQKRTQSRQTQLPVSKPIQSQPNIKTQEQTTQHHDPKPVTEWPSDEHKTVYQTLTQKPQALADIAQKCGMSIGQVTAILFELGVPDPVKAYPGKLFSL